MQDEFAKVFAPAFAPDKPAYYGCFHKLGTGSNDRKNGFHVPEGIKVNIVSDSEAHRPKQSHAIR